MNIRSVQLKLTSIILLCFFALSMVFLYLYSTFKPYTVWSEPRHREPLTNANTIKFPTAEDLQTLKEEFEEFFSFLDEEQSIANGEIVESYEAVKSSLTCHDIWKHYNVLVEHYDVYIEQLEKIQAHITSVEELYNHYSQMIDNIPLYAKSLRDLYEQEFNGTISALYAEFLVEKETYDSDYEAVEQMYQDATTIAMDRFNSDYEPLCHITYAEGGNSDYDKLCVLNVIDNRIKHSAFPNTLIAVLFQTGQYSTVRAGGRYYLEPSTATRKLVEDYMKAKVETDMPDNVVYQALFTQGSGIWKRVPGGNVYCYY